MSNLVSESRVAKLGSSFTHLPTYQLTNLPTYQLTHLPILSYLCVLLGYRVPRWHSGCEKKIYVVAAILSSTSRTLLVSSSVVNGFGRKATCELRMPCCSTTSSV